MHTLEANITEFFFRTEDIRPDEVMEYFVESKQDRAIINSLKSRNPTIVLGSRGVGKSFLLRIAQNELMKSFDEERIFPVYMTFVRSSLLASGDQDQFKHWMIARICSAIVRSIAKAGLSSRASRSATALLGDSAGDFTKPSKLEAIADQYENSWQTPGSQPDTTLIPTVENLKDALEDLCAELNIRRFALFIDEAAHIFLPEQQRQFFTLFRDLRSHFVTCNAAVYPGVTSFGDTFQPAHDASLVYIDRDILSPDYVENMREIVEKQADSSILRDISANAKNFAILAYAATGNPRLLLKTLERSPKINSGQVNQTIREFYRTEIWAEHSQLAEKYSGHRTAIDWGRTFLEAYVLPDLKSKNDQYLAAEKSSTAFFWIHRDAPVPVKQALRILSYTGVVVEQSSGIKASRGEIGTRYQVNLGCLFALESTPTATSFEVAKALTPKRMTEFGANHTAYKSLPDDYQDAAQQGGTIIAAQLAKYINVLDLSYWQKSKLSELGLRTVGDVLHATEEKLKEAYYVGDVRARRMRNAAIASVWEYLSG